MEPRDTGRSSPGAGGTAPTRMAIARFFRRVGGACVIPDAPEEFVVALALRRIAEIPPVSLAAFVGRCLRDGSDGRLAGHSDGGFQADTARRVCGGSTAADSP